MYVFIKLLFTAFVVVLISEIAKRNVSVILTGEGADELMPIAWPQLHPWELPPRPKRNGHVIERVMKKITNSGYLPSGPTKGIRHESKL